MESRYHRLTDEEKERNKHGPMHVYTYTDEVLGLFKIISKNKNKNKN